MRWGIVLVVLFVPGVARAADIQVAAGGSIAAAIDQAMPGDNVILASGTYDQKIVSKRGGSAGAPITIKAATPRGAIVRSAGNVVSIAHAYVTLEGLVIDGQDGDGDAIRIETAGGNATIRDCEVENVRRDCIDMGAPDSVTIEKSLIHDCLNATGSGCASDACRVDAHGIVGGAVKDLVIRDTEIHTFSGDALQVDPGRASPGWDRVTVERCKMWLGPLAAAKNGFAAGVVPGENAIDTKTPASGRSTLTVRDSIAYGFGGGLIGNMAAFNMKENVDATFDRVTVSASEIGFRVRNPSNVIIRNTVMHGMTAAAIRYEDGVPKVVLEHVTFGNGNAKPFVEASSDATKIESKNVLFLGASLPTEIAGVASNLAASESAFVDAAKDDYQLASGSPAIDKGETIAGITADRAGVARVQGSAPDIGAYEHCPGTCTPALDAGPGSSSGGSGASSSGGASSSSGSGGGDGASTAAEDSGCGCRMTRTTAHGALAAALAVLGLAVIACRRHAASHQHRPRRDAAQRAGDAVPRSRARGADVSRGGRARNYRSPS
jgi:uncharacterized membrane protein YgcG